MAMVTLTKSTHCWSFLPSTSPHTELPPTATSPSGWRLHSLWTASFRDPPSIHSHSITLLNDRSQVPPLLPDAAGQGPLKPLQLLSVPTSHLPWQGVDQLSVSPLNLHDELDYPVHRVLPLADLPTQLGQVTPPPVHLINSWLAGVRVEQAIPPTMVLAMLLARQVPNMVKRLDGEFGLDRLLRVSNN